MSELSSIADKIFKMKYQLGKEEDWSGLSWRVASYIASAEKDYGKTDEEVLETTKDFFNLIDNRLFIPGGRILKNSGTGVKNLFNCFFFNIGDSREEIYQALKDSAEIFAWGGGLGIRVSDLREEGALIRSTGTYSSGPLSFMELFNTTGDVIQQASRRAAEIALMDVSHPDIEKFLKFKSTLNNKNKNIVKEFKRDLKELDRKEYNVDVLEKTLVDSQMNHFNISVEIPDKFMEAVEKDEDWDLISPATKEVVKTIKARVLLLEMAHQIWESGDPGIFFTDRVRKDNMVKYVDEVMGSNPCFHPDTLVETVNGRVKIKDITEPTFVLTMTDEGTLGVQRASPSWISRKNAKTIKLVLSNNEELIVTPDHKIFSKDRGWVYAQDLNINEELAVKYIKEVGTNCIISSKQKVEAICVLSISEGIETDVYDISVEETHNVIANSVIAHNCAEVNLLSYEPCDLGSVNLSMLYDGAGINLPLFEYIIRKAVRFLDNTITLSYNNVPRVNERARDLRRIGLGVFGFADLLAKLNIPYNSQDALILGNYLSWFLSFFAWITSIELAYERGPFPLYDPEKADLTVVEKVLTSKYVSKRASMEEVRKIGLRNVSVTALAPTGSIAIIGEANSVIEPFYALAYRRHITLGEANLAKDTIVEINPILMSKIEAMANPLTQSSLDTLKEELLKTGSIQHLEFIPEDIRKVFVTAHDITPQDHINMQAVWQEYTSNAVSKTINLLSNTTPRDIYDALINMWKAGLKSSTLYRNNSKAFQILNTGK